MEDAYILSKKQKFSFPFEEDSYSCGDDQVQELFGKRFVLSDDDDYVLPEPDSLFTVSSWQDKELLNIKNDLNKVKNCLNDFNLAKWQMHTKQRNKAGDVLHHVRKYYSPEFITQAWCKFYEISSREPIVDGITSSNEKFASVHLCEAPGAFITALNHYLKLRAAHIEWNWLATTLNPYNEGNQVCCMIDDDRFIRYTLANWCFGADNTGNLMDLKNLDCLIQRATEIGNKVLLVTADGSIDCADMPDEQEEAVAQLHFCEVVAMLHILETDGNFLLKVFTILECRSISLMYLLACCFKKVVVIKPATSKEGNSEMYIVCLKFKGRRYIASYLSILRKHYEKKSERIMFHKDDIPGDFLEKIRQCSDFFKSSQCKVILGNVITFRNADAGIHEDIKHIKHKVAIKYVKVCQLAKLLPEHEIVGRMSLQFVSSVNISRKTTHESFNERCEKKKLSPMDRLQDILLDAEQIVIKKPANNAYEFKHMLWTKELYITFGKVFHRINSSRFCEHRVLSMKQMTEDILRKIGRTVQFPLDKDIQSLTEKIKQTCDYKILMFRYTNVYKANRNVSSIYNKLKELQRKDTLVLLGYSLLTQIDIGLLFLLRQTFEVTKLKFHDEVGCIIVLKHYLQEKTIIECFHKIYETSGQKGGGKDLLTVLPILDLCESDMFEEIVQLNHWLIKLYIKCVAKEIHLS